MTVRDATVLYEDKRDISAGSFGLHLLVLALTCDKLGLTEMHDLQDRILGIPKGGNTRVVAELAANYRELRNSSANVIAVLDRDRAHELGDRRKKVTRKSTDAEIVASIRSKWSIDPEARIFLLAENTESVIRAVGACDPTVKEDALGRALEGKRRLERDRVLSRAAYAASSVRECVVARVPTLVPIANALCEIVEPGRGSPPASADHRKRRKSGR